MCACPYDYTGPMPAEGLGFNDRAGSVLMGDINEGEWDSEVSQDAMGETIVDPSQEFVPEGEPIMAPPMGNFGPQTRVNPEMRTYPPQARPVVHRAG